ncbi:Response regulator protein modulated with CBS domain pair [uncultured Desulfatiglans sp.]|nr:Response regulator protein modulated with CBS domain pair [uncultured Desulfatiglans sp.]
MNRTIKVLMVDDEDQFRATTKKLLTRKGFETIVAASGEEAIEQLQKNPDVVVLDIKMPGMDGHAALKEIRKRAPNLPVIMLTGHGALPSAKEARKEGAFDYLTKPCDIDVLAAKIGDAVRSVEKGGPPAEKTVKDIMVPFGNYTTVTTEQTVGEAVEALRESYGASLSTSRIMETGHRSVLVLDRGGEVQGVLTIKDLLEAIMPAYLSAPRPSTADSIQYSPLFWKGMFTIEVKKLVKKRVQEVMSRRPSTIDAEANLMEASYAMAGTGERRLLVMDGKKAVGVVREQDLFFEMERIQRS